MLLVNIQLEYFQLTSALLTKIKQIHPVKILLCAKLPFTPNNVPANENETVVGVKSSELFFGQRFELVAGQIESAHHFKIFVPFRHKLDGL